jgi:glycosyltransferase involved in cell wall biosynthesis
MIPNPAGDLTKLSEEQIFAKIQRGETENLKELVNALLNILEHVETWKKRRDTMAKEARRLFSIQKMVDKYLQEFSELV